MLNPKKIARWRVEPSCFSFDVIYRAGKNQRECCSRHILKWVRLICRNDLLKLHKEQCHPGVTKMLHVVRIRNLAFLVEDVKKAVKTCQICAELKPRTRTIIKSIQPFERFARDFKRLLRRKQGISTYWQLSTRTLVFRLLSEVLYSIRMLLCTATNATLHERVFSFPCQSSTGTSLPSWFSRPGTVLPRRHARQSKHECLRIK